MLASPLSFLSVGEETDCLRSKELEKGWFKRMPEFLHAELLRWMLTENSCHDEETLFVEPKVVCV